MCKSVRVGKQVNGEIMQITHWQMPRRSRSNVSTAAMVSLIVVLPFMVLELVNRRNFEEFAFPLFGLLWLLGLSFILILLAFARKLRVQPRAEGNPLRFLPAAVCMILIAWLWVTLVADQLPCFLGVPNCD
jgi:hypothetical protein